MSNAQPASFEGKGISLSFGGIEVLHDVDISFKPGQITGLIGPNGAGKTSLFNCLTGAYKPQKGNITYGDIVLDGQPPSTRAANGIARSFQSVALCPDLTVVENVMVGMLKKGKAGWFSAFLPLKSGNQERAEMRVTAIQALSELGLEHTADLLPSMLPPGTLRLVEIARATVGKPSVLLLDEPAAGLNVSETRDLMRVLRQLSTPELVMVVVEHDMDLVMTICDRLYVLNFGSFVAEGTPEEVRQDPEVVRIYLGSDDD